MIIDTFAKNRSRLDASHEQMEAKKPPRLLKMSFEWLQTHVRHFLRVDMIQRDRGGFWISELEFFGNEFIHFEAFDNADELMNELILSVSKWMQSCCSKLQ